MHWTDSILERMERGRGERKLDESARHFFAEWSDKDPLFLALRREAGFHLIEVTQAEWMAARAVANQLKRLSAAESPDEARKMRERARERIKEWISARRVMHEAREFMQCIDPNPEPDGEALHIRADFHQTRVTPVRGAVTI